MFSSSEIPTGDVKMLYALPKQIRDTERYLRSCHSESIKLYNIDYNTKLSEKMETFWADNKNKEQFQVLFSKYVFTNALFPIGLSGMNNGKLSISFHELNSNIDEADISLIDHLDIISNICNYCEYYLQRYCTN